MSKLRVFIINQVRDNAVSLVLQLLMVLAIAFFAIRDISSRLDKAEAAVVTYVRGELAKIESVPDDIEAISASLATLTGTTVDALVENRDEVVEGVKEYGPRALGRFLTRHRQPERPCVGVELTEEEFDASKGE